MTYGDQKDWRTEDELGALPNKMNCLLHSYHSNTVQCLQNYLPASQQVLARPQLQLSNKINIKDIKGISFPSVQILGFSKVQQLT